MVLLNGDERRAANLSSYFVALTRGTVNMQCNRHGVPKVGERTEALHGLTYTHICVFDVNLHFDNSWLLHKFNGAKVKLI